MAKTSIHSVSPEEQIRYGRQLIISCIGAEGQEKIRSASIFIGGAGGLGSPVLYYLAAAGVGHMTVVDGDNVEMSNLNRQIIHRATDIGMAKVESAAEKLLALNPHCVINPVKAKMKEENIADLVGDCSVIIDATDNLHTRRVLNQASLKLGIPFIYGGVNEFTGMITTFVPGETPCFDCLFSGMEAPEKTVGVIGPLPGTVGSLQALEALKIILGMEGLLKNRLLYFSGIDMSFREIKVGKNPDCKTCKPKTEVR